MQTMYMLYRKISQPALNGRYELRLCEERTRDWRSVNTPPGSNDYASE